MIRTTEFCSCIVLFLVVVNYLLTTKGLSKSMWLHPKTKLQGDCLKTRWLKWSDQNANLTPKKKKRELKQYHRDVRKTKIFSKTDVAVNIWSVVHNLYAWFFRDYHSLDKQQRRLHKAAAERSTLADTSSVSPILQKKSHPSTAPATLYLNGGIGRRLQ